MLRELRVEHAAAGLAHGLVARERLERADNEVTQLSERARRARARRRARDDGAHDRGKRHVRRRGRKRAPRQLAEGSAHRRGDVRQLAAQPPRRAPAHEPLERCEPQTVLTTRARAEIRVVRRGLRARGRREAYLVERADAAARVRVRVPRTQRGREVDEPRRLLARWQRRESVSSDGRRGRHARFISPRAGACGARRRSFREAAATPRLARLRAQERRPRRVEREGVEQSTEGVVERAQRLCAFEC